MIVRCVVSLLFLAMQRTQSATVKCETRCWDLEPSLAPHVLGFRARGTGSNFTTGKNQEGTLRSKRWTLVRACGTNVTQQKIKNRKRSQNTSGFLEPCHNVWHGFGTRDSVVPKNEKKMKRNAIKKRNRKNNMKKKRKQASRSVAFGAYEVNLATLNATDHVTPVTLEATRVL